MNSTHGYNLGVILTVATLALGLVMRCETASAAAPKAGNSGLFRPKQDESMRAFLNRVSRTTGRVFVCPAELLSKAPQRIIAKPLSASGIGVLLAGVFGSRFVARDRYFVILPLEEAKAHHRIQSETEYLAGQCKLLAFADTFSKNQIDRMAANKGHLSPDALTPLQQRMFWEIYDADGNLPQRKTVKKVYLGFTRTKSLRLGLSGKRPFEFMGAFDYTSAGLIPRDPILAPVKPSNLPLPLPNSSLEHSQKLHQTLIQKFATAGTVSSGESIRSGLRQLQQRTGVRITVEAPSDAQYPFISSPSLRASEWYEIMTLFHGLSERRRGQALSLSAAGTDKRPVERVQMLEIVKRFDPALFETYSHLTKSVNRKLTRLPEPVQGIPFAPEGFAGPFEPSTPYPARDLSRNQQEWLKRFIRVHPDTWADYRNLDISRTRLELRDTLWLFGMADERNFSFRMD